MSNSAQNSFDTWYTSKGTRTDFGVDLPKSLLMLDDLSSDLDSLDATAQIDDLTYVEDWLPSLLQVPAISKMVRPDRGQLAAVNQIWEGTVLSVNMAERTMFVKLHDRGNILEDHSAEISLEWVVDQDLDLVSPGAVFYWTIYKEIKRSSISNSEEIRFRRLPNWTKRQIDEVYKEAEMLRAKFRPGRVAD
ncbi:MAG: hypothetical protein EOO88_34040 [Pedobacter sp.]|nr:MAG: hypothetical protein EOO88_34040 [Pedobacter sp.]